MIFRPLTALRLFASVLTALCTSPNARADDTSNGVTLPALEAMPPGSATLGTATLSLGGAQSNRAVTLGLTVLRTRASKALAIHIPPFGWLGEAEPYPDRQFPELHVMLNGKSAYTVSQEHVEFDGADITADIASAGLDPFTITTTPPLVDPEQGASSAFAHLKKRGAITTDQDGNNLAQWTAGRDISISLEGKAAAQLGLTYTARPAFATVQSLNELATRFSLSNYCVTPNSLRHLLDGVPTKTGFAVEAFTIPIGIGATPPAHLRLTLARWMPAAEYGFPSSPHLLRLFCGMNRQPIFTGMTGVSQEAVPAVDGSVRVLVISSIQPAS
jgi:hypothetical protein